MREGGENPAFFCLRRSARGFYSAKRRPGPARLRRLCVLRRLFLSSSLPLFHAQSLSLFGLASRSLSSLFFSSFSSSYRFRPPLLLPSFSFSSSAPVSWHCREKRNTGKEEKNGRKSAGPCSVKNKLFAPGPLDPAQRSGRRRAFRALRKAKPPRRVGRPFPSLGGGAA